MAPVLRDYPAYVYAALAVLVGIYFLSSPTQNLRSFLTTLVIAGLAAFGIHELRKQSSEEFPDADYGDVFGRTKDKVVGAVKDANLGERASKLRLPEMRKPARRERGADGDPPRRQRGRPPGPPRTPRRHCTRKASSPTRSWPRRRRGCSAATTKTPEPQSPPPGSNRKPPDYKSGALPIELGGQLVFLCPAYALALPVAWGIDTQIHAANRARLLPE